MNARSPGRHFLQVPGPTNVPGRVLRAISEPTIDHRGPGFADLGRAVLTGLKRIFRTGGPVLVFPASGTGAWEAALVNTLSPGDAVVMVRTGWFATLWSERPPDSASNRLLSRRTGGAAPIPQRSRRRCA